MKAFVKLFKCFFILMKNIYYIVLLRNKINKIDKACFTVCLCLLYSLLWFSNPDFLNYNLEVFGSKKTKGPKQDSQNWCRSVMFNEGEP
jgi:hypothetical protein